MPTVIRSATFITIGIILSRILGLARDLIVAAKWGTSEYSDFVLLLINFPDMVVNLFTGAAISALLIPMFVQATEEDQKRIYSLAMHCLGYVGLVIGGLTLVLSGPITELVAPGFSEGTKQQVEWAIRVLSLAILISFVAGVPRSFLLSKEKFNLTAYESLFFNLPIAFALFVFVTADRPDSVVWVIIGASIIRFLFFLYGAGRSGMRPGRAKIPFNRSVVLRFISLNIITGSGVLFLMLVRAQATNLGPGNFTLFSYFLKVLDVPVGVLVTIVGAVALPKLSKGPRNDNAWQLMRIVGFSVVGAAIMIAVFQSLSQFEFSFFKIKAAEISLLLRVLAIGILILPARMALSYLQGLEYSMNQSHKSLITATIAITVSTSGLYLTDNLAFSNLAWFLNLYYYISTFGLYFLMRKQVHKRI